MRRGFVWSADSAFLISTSFLLGFTVLSGLILSSSYVKADDVVDDVAITIPVSCTMSGSGMNSHTATLSPGTYSAASGSTYENGIGTTTLTTFCNDYNGFSIYAIGYTSDSYGNNTLVGTNTGSTINTKVYASGDSTSNWSMKIAKVTDSSAYEPNNMTIDNSYTSWHTVPNAYQRVAHFKASTGSSATDDTKGGRITTTYAAYMSTAQAADSYTGKVKYVVVHPYDTAAPIAAINYSIVYNDATGESNIMPSAQTGTLSGSGANVNLSSIIPHRTFYNFVGWCSTNNTSNPFSCSGTTYNANSQYAISPSGGSNQTIQLYAIWLERETLQLIPEDDSYEFEDNNNDYYYEIIAGIVDDCIGRDRMPDCLPEEASASLPEEYNDEIIPPTDAAVFGFIDYGSSGDLSPTMIIDNLPSENTIGVLVGAIVDSEVVDYKYVDAEPINGSNTSYVLDFDEEFLDWLNNRNIVILPVTIDSTNI